MIVWKITTFLRRAVNEELLNRKFCSFVVSNGTDSDRDRERFFYKLCEYKRVDSGGAFLNNIGGRVEDKVEFEHKHKFAIAFENARHSVITEKLEMAFAAQTVPIYWGNPHVTEIYNSKAFINCHEYQSFEEVIERVKEIDNDDELYLSMLREPAFIKYRTAEEWGDDLKKFLDNIVETPKSEAILRSKFGWNRTMNQIRFEGFNVLNRKKKRKRIMMIILGRIFYPFRNSKLAYAVKRKLM